MRTAITATVAALLAGLLVAAPAQAQGACKPGVTTDDYFKQSVGPSLKAAKANAARIWSRLARAKYGARYAKFDAAKPRRFGCNTCRRQTASWCPKGSYSCTVWAKPCPSG